jgi:hypothetical protein
MNSVASGRPLILFDITEPELILLSDDELMYLSGFEYLNFSYETILFTQALPPLDLNDSLLTAL